jgi:RNA polymerase sigma factor (sigma-70 family)
MEKTNVTESAASSGPRRQKREISKLFQGRLRKSEMTEEEAKEKAKEKILNLLQERRSYWLALVRRFVPDHYAEDVLQIGSMEIFTSLQRMDARDINVPEAWITTLLLRRAIDAVRRGEAEARALQKQGLPPESWRDPDVVDATAGYLLIREVMADVLTDRQHEIYILRHVGKFNSPEIAKALGIKAALVRKELSKAQAILGTAEVRKRLRERLQTDG